MQTSLTTFFWFLLWLSRFFYTISLTDSHLKLELRSRCSPFNPTTTQKKTTATAKATTTTTLSSSPPYSSLFNSCRGPSFVLSFFPSASFLLSTHGSQPNQQEKNERMDGPKKTKKKRRLLRNSSSFITSFLFSFFPWTDWQSSKNLPHSTYQHASLFCFVLFQVLSS